MKTQTAHCVLGVTSLWILIPAWFALHRDVIFAAVLLWTCIVSTVFWLEPQWQSPLHHADRFCACMVFVCALWHQYQSALVSQGYLYPMAVIAAYLVSYACGLTVAHLLFRFVFFTWLQELLGNQSPALSGDAMYACAYVAHVAFVCQGYPANYWSQVCVAVAWVASFLTIKTWF